MGKRHPADKKQKRLSYKDIALKSAKAGTRGAKATNGLVLKIILTVFLIILCTGSFLVVFFSYEKTHCPMSFLSRCPNSVWLRQALYIIGTML
jgi:hypothetical protein